MVAFARRVGRLVEIRDDGKPVPPDVQPQFARVIQLADEVGAGAKVVVCTDLRRGHAITQEQANRITLAIRTSLTRVDRAAILIPSASIAAMQMQRVHGDAHRRDDGGICRTPEEAYAWLDPVLTPAERTRLRQFLES
jgi:hypothetical protein